VLRDRHDEADIYRDGVNVAARLEGTAFPGGICVSGAAHDQVPGKLDVAFENSGEQSLKNLAQSVRVYRVTQKYPGCGRQLLKPEMGKANVQLAESVVSI
jgi:class 3 adenylate cyclase